MFLVPAIPIGGGEGNWKANNVKTQDFEAELRLVDPDLSIRPNGPHKLFPALEELAAVTYRGVSLITVPSYEIFDEPNPAYGVDIRMDGRFIPHRTRPEALGIVRAKLEQLRDPEYRDQFFGTGEYSDAKLREKVEAVPELVEDVPMDVQEIGGESDHSRTSTTETVPLEIVIPKEKR